MQRAAAVLPLLVVAALVAASGAAQPAHGMGGAPLAGPGLVLLLHHPYPDAADPLGFPYPDGGAVGYYHARYAHLDAERDGFDFPHMVMDGVLPIEGIPDGPVPIEATRAAYAAAYEQRRAVEAPVAMEVAATVGPTGATVEVVAIGRSDLGSHADGLRLWVAVVEDHVRYAPPPRLSNGVVDHRFTVRAIADLGTAWQAGPVVHAFAGEGWEPEQTFVAAWLQNGGQATRFAPHEVVQATIDAAGDAVATRQDGKGVLMQLYSATWCDPCLLGDAAAEELAAEHGPATHDPPARPGYYRPPGAFVVVTALLVAAVVALAPLRRAP